MLRHAFHRVPPASAAGLIEARRRGCDERGAVLLLVQSAVPGASERRACATVLPADLSASIPCRRASLGARCARDRAAHRW